MMFSVVIPTYNREKVVVRAIESVMKQTCQDFEIIVVDDGSIDNTKEIVLSIDDNRIKYVYQTNQGATAARNNGILNASGLYVSFLDSDDVWHPQMLEKQLEAYEIDKKVGWVYTNIQGIDANGISHPFGIPLGIQGNVYSKALTQGYVAPTTVISAKKEALVDVGMFDVNLPASQDDDICFKLAKNYKVAYVPEFMASMYIDPQNRISINMKKVSMGWWMLWNKYETDVLSYCGKDVMVYHYFECARRFAFIQDKEYLKKALSKIKSVKGTLPMWQKLLLYLSVTSIGSIKSISDRILNRI